MLVYVFHQLIIGQVPGLRAKSSNDSVEGVGGLLAAHTNKCSHYREHQRCDREGYLLINSSRSQNQKAHFEDS